MPNRPWARVLAALLAVSAALSLGACRGSRRKTIAVIPKSTTHLFWVSVQAGALAAGKQFDVEVLWNGTASETEYDRQIQIVDSMIVRHVDGIALAAADRTALVKPLDRAMAAGIPVTIFDSGLDSSNYVTFIATNNVAAGEMGGRKLGQLLGGKGKVGVVLHATGSRSTMDRELGFDRVMAAEFPGIRVVGRQYGMSDRGKARAAAENILTANPDLDGFFASTEPSSAGIALALKSRGRAGKIRMVGFDWSDTMIADMRAGTLDATVVQDPFGIGFEAVRTLVDKLNGHAPPRQIDLSARVVTKADLDLPEIRKLMFPDIRQYLK